MTPRHEAIQLLSESETVTRAINMAESVARNLNPDLDPAHLTHVARGLLHEAINLSPR